MENQEGPKKIKPEESEQQKKNLEQKQEEQIPKKDDVILLSNINQEIDQKKESINNTMSNINNIRSKLGLETSTEIPPSVQQAQESIEKLKEEESKLESFNFKIVESIPEEVPEEYISRLMKSIADDYISNDPYINNQNSLIKRAYYSKYVNHSMVEFFSNKENPNLIKDLLLKLELNNNNKFSKEKNELVFNKLDKKIWNSSKESADGDINIAKDQSDYENR